MSQPVPGAWGATARAQRTPAVPVEHAARETYRSWVWQHVPTKNARYSRMAHFDEFTARWPQLADFFAAPLRLRLLDDADPVAGKYPHGGASVAMPYLSYLSLVRGIGLDYELLLGRQFASPFTNSVHHGGLGVDTALFEAHVARLTRLGYSGQGARNQLAWPLGRMLLHRGDPDLRALTTTDLDELRAAVAAFSSRMRTEPLRVFYARSRAAQGQKAGKAEKHGPAKAYMATGLTRVHAAHVLLFDIGQVDRVPAGRVDAGWRALLAPPQAPQTISVVVERYLRLRLEANLDRPQTVLHSRYALHRFVRWLVAEHPEVTSLNQLTRTHAEEFLRWLGTQTNERTGAPLAMSTRRSVVTLLARFVNETTAWGWADVPGRVLFVRGDIPRSPRRCRDSSQTTNSTR